MPLTARASFKNSRVTPRSATSSANVDKINVATGPGNTVLAAENSNRTYLTCRNENNVLGDDIRYDYFDNANILTEGFLLKASEAIDLESTQTIYARAVANPVLISTDEGVG